MMSHPSSTFSSERSGAYLALTLALGVTLALAFAEIGLVGVKSGLAGRRGRLLLDDRLTEVDRPGFDMSRGGGRPPSFRTSEPWLVHNMFYLLAASALDKSVNAERPRQ